jgi:hypothetical protein
MTKIQKLLPFKLLLGATIFAVQTNYGSNITIRDTNGGNDAANEIGFSGLGGAPGKHSTSVNNDHEDNETESGFSGSHINTIGAQKWDLEGMSINGTTLSLVGGFDFKNGEFDNTTLIHPGQLFIKIGGSAPGFNPLTDTTTTVKNTYGYNYAVDLVAGKVYSLTPDSDLTTVKYDFLGSNPWKFAGSGGGTDVETHFYSGLKPTGSPNSVVGITGESSFSTLLGDASDTQNSDHNIATVDLSDFLTFPEGTDIWFHYAEECGNDSMRGLLHVPDTGSSLTLMLLGLAGLAIFRRQPRQV